MNHIDFNYWRRRYEEDYPKDVSDRYPIFKDAYDKEQREKSPYFETMSKVLRGRGYFLKLEFVSICLWKTTRQKKAYEENSEEEIKTYTQKAINASTDRDKIESLINLNGVGIPVASAILTVIDPARYCVIDFRAWRTLKWLQGINFSFYENYSKFLDDYRNYGTLRIYHSFIEEIREIAKKNNQTPRQVEMALWKFDKEKGT